MGFNWPSRKGAKEKDAAAAKTERYDTRGEIGELAFQLEHLAGQDAGLSGIKQGEVQSEELLAKATALADNETFWNAIPDQGVMKIGNPLRGAAQVPYRREELRDQLRSLINKARPAA